MSEFVNQTTQTALPIFVIGGGTKGAFAACHAAASAPGHRVFLFEAETTLMPRWEQRGRRACICPDAYDPVELAEPFLRNPKAALSVFSRYGPAELLEFFESAGAQLMLQGNIWEISGGTDALRGCLQKELDRRGVQTRFGQRIVGVDAAPEGRRFWLTFEDDSTLQASRLILAVGDLSMSKCRQVLTQMGHNVRPSLSTLVTLKTEDRRLRGIGGKADKVRLCIEGTQANALGELDFEPWGLGGPAVLDFCATHVERLHKLKHRFHLSINWLEGATLALAERKRSRPQTVISEDADPTLPPALWRRQVAAAGIEPHRKWHSLNKAEFGLLKRNLCDDRIAITGKRNWSQEKSVCGGVEADQIDFRSLQSRLIPGLHLVGQSVDVDALAGGSNALFGYASAAIAGTAAAQDTA
jgi:predicted Rossmann fold flavoprotein